jgi:hypothetical protein
MLYSREAEMKLKGSGAELSCLVVPYPSFCAAIILRNFEWVSPLDLPNPTAQDVIHAVVVTNDNYEERVSAIFIADAVGGYAHSHLFPLFNDGESYDVGDDVWACQKSVPYFNPNSGNEVQHVVLYRTSYWEEEE